MLLVALLSLVTNVLAIRENGHRTDVLQGRPRQKQQMMMKNGVPKKGCCPQKKRCPRKYSSCTSSYDSCSWSSFSSPSYSTTSSCTSSASRCKSKSCSMSVSWEESQVDAEIIRKRIKNPRHRLYYCPPASCSYSSSSWSDCHPTEYTTVELIRPHIARHHQRKIRVKERVCPMSTEIEIIRKKKKECPTPCEKKKKYQVICKKDKCEEKRCSKKQCNRRKQCPPKKACPRRK